MASVYERLADVTRNSQLGAIIRCAYGEARDAKPRFFGKATVTSDGYVQCSFVRANGDIHRSAFVGSFRDLQHNVRGVADHINLSNEDRAEFFKTMREWISDDYRTNKEWF